MPIEQVGQAVISVGDQNCHSGTMVRKRQPVLHQEAVGYVVEMSFELGYRQVDVLQVPLQARQDATLCLVRRIVGMQNSAAMGDGFTAGGAIIKDKLFWIYTYDQQSRLF